MKVPVQLLSIILRNFAPPLIRTLSCYNRRIRWHHVKGHVIKMDSVYVPSYVVPSELKASTSSSEVFVHLTTQAFAHVRTTLLCFTLMEGSFFCVIPFNISFGVVIGPAASSAK